jgi:hypothetical protein
MFVRLFKSTQPIPLVLLTLIAAAMWLISWMFHFRVHPPDGLPLYDLTFYLLRTLPGWVLAFTGFLLVTSQGIHFNYLLNKHDILYRPSWLPALLYVVLGGLFPAFLGFHPILFVNSIIILALERIIALYKNPSPLSLAFDSALLLSIAALFYLPAAVFFIFYGIAMLIIRPFNWREAVAGTLGLLIPFLFAFLYYFLSNRLESFYERIFKAGIATDFTLTRLSAGPFLYSAVFVVLLLVMAVLRLQGNYYKNVTKARLVQQMMLLFIPFGLFTVIISRDTDLWRYMILLTPFSMYLGYYFLSTNRKLIAELLFLLLLAAWGANYFYF